MHALLLLTVHGCWGQATAHQDAPKQQGGANQGIGKGSTGRACRKGTSQTAAHQHMQASTQTHMQASAQTTYNAATMHAEEPQRPMMRMVHAASAGCCNGPGACPTCTKLQLPLQAASRWVVLMLLHCPAASLPRVSRCQRCKGCVTHTPKPSNHPHPTAPKHAHTQQPTHKSTKLQVSAHSSPIKCSNLRPILAKHGQRWHQSLAQNGFE